MNCGVNMNVIFLTRKHRGRAPSSVSHGFRREEGARPFPLIKRSGPVSRVLSSTGLRRKAPTLLKGDHSSGTTVAGDLLQPTRGLRTGRSQTPLYLALHRMGFAKLPVSPPALVSSYLTLSPLPRRSSMSEDGRSALCGTFPGVAPGRRYRPSCPAVLGLSSRLCQGNGGRSPGPLHKVILTQIGKRGKGRGEIDLEV